MIYNIHNDSDIQNPFTELALDKTACRFHNLVKLHLRKSMIFPTKVITFKELSSQKGTIQLFSFQREDLKKQVIGRKLKMPGF